MELWSGFLIGLFGSLHCTGMCGPLVIALPFGERSRFSFLLSRLLYNFGRVITYSFIGLIFGLFGRGISLFGLQQNLSVALGITILLAVIIPFRFRNKIRELSPYKNYSLRLKNTFGKYIANASFTSLFIMGILNGFLPCGLVYVALAGAMITSSALSGMAFMALFGIGTLPMMFAVSILGKYINVNLRRKFSRMIPFFAVILAFILILRGLNLGIPYLSPKLQLKAQVTEVKSSEPDCCR